MSDEFETLGLASMGALSGEAPVEEATEAASKNVCANCGNTLQGSFCEHCGQLASDFHRPIWTLTKEVLSDALGFDGRIARTLPALMLRPGRVTRAYLEGKRARYIPPFRLFLLSSLVFFFTLFAMGQRVGWGDDLYVMPMPNGGYSITIGAPDFLGGDEAGEISALTTDEIKALLEEALAEDDEVDIPEAYLQTAVQVIENQPEITMGIERWVPRLSVLILPLMTIFLTLGYAWVRRVYVYDHIITSLHFQSFAYLLGALIMLAVFFVSGHAGWALFFIPVYLYRQMRVTYQSGRITSFIRALSLFLLLVICLLAVSIGASVLGYLDLN